LRKGKVDEAVRSFNKTYMEVVRKIIDHLRSLESTSAGH
jgi:hypothetical protein